jgi:predicted Zn-dependent protease
MRSIRNSFVALIVFGLASWALAQGVIDDRGENTVNHNFFAASQNEALRGLLLNIRVHHFKPCPHSPQGTYHDIAIGRYDYAKEDLTYILERFVNDPVALQLITPITLATKDHAWGISRFEHALRWYPNYAMTHAQYGAYLVDIGNVPGGIEKLETAVKMDPKLVAGYVWLSKAYSKHGKADLARQAAEKAKELGYKG